MKITWLDHSCFTVESQGCRIVLDPYKDGSVPGLAPVRVEADQVLCSRVATAMMTTAEPRAYPCVRAGHPRTERDGTYAAHLYLGHSGHGLCSPQRGCQLTGAGSTAPLIYHSHHAPEG